MKTGNNVQKTVSRLTAVLVMIMLSGAVHSAFAATGKTITASKSKKMFYHVILQEECDATLHLEPWMINDAFFKCQSSAMTKIPYADSLASFTEKEKPAVLESWMTDNSSWGFGR